MRSVARAVLALSLALGIAEADAAVVAPRPVQGGGGLSRDADAPSDRAGNGSPSALDLGFRDMTAIRGLMATVLAGQGGIARRSDLPVGSINIAMPAFDGDDRYRLAVNGGSLGRLAKAYDFRSTVTPLPTPVLLLLPALGLLAWAGRRASLRCGKLSQLH